MNLLGSPTGLKPGSLDAKLASDTAAGPAEVPSFSAAPAMVELRSLDESTSTGTQLELGQGSTPLDALLNAHLGLLVAEPAGRGLSESSISAKVMAPAEQAPDPMAKGSSTFGLSLEGHEDHVHQGPSVGLTPSAMEAVSETLVLSPRLSEQLGQTHLLDEGIDIEERSSFGDFNDFHAASAFIGSSTDGRLGIGSGPASTAGDSNAGSVSTVSVHKVLQFSASSLGPAYGTMTAPGASLHVSASGMAPMQGQRSATTSSCGFPNQMRASTQLQRRARAPSTASAAPTDGAQTDDIADLSDFTGASESATYRARPSATSVISSPGCEGDEEPDEGDVDDNSSLGTFASHHAHHRPHHSHHRNHGESSAGQDVFSDRGLDGPSTGGPGSTRSGADERGSGHSHNSSEQDSDAPQDDDEFISARPPATAHVDLRTLRTMGLGAHLAPVPRGSGRHARGAWARGGGGGGGGSIDASVVSWQAPSSSREVPASSFAAPAGADDDFGDFTSDFTSVSEAPSTQPASVAVAASGPGSLAQHDDDMGSLASRHSNAGDDDDDFGNFAAAGPAAAGMQASAGTSAAGMSGGVVDSLHQVAGPSGSGSSSGSGLPTVSTTPVGSSAGAGPSTSSLPSGLPVCKSQVVGGGAAGLNAGHSSSSGMSGPQVGGSTGVSASGMEFGQQQHSRGGGSSSSDDDDRSSRGALPVIADSGSPPPAASTAPRSALPSLTPPPSASATPPMALAAPPAPAAGLFTVAPPPPPSTASTSSVTAALPQHSVADPFDDSDEDEMSSFVSAPASTPAASAVPVPLPPAHITHAAPIPLPASKEAKSLLDLEGSEYLKAVEALLAPLLPPAVSAAAAMASTTAASASSAAASLGLELLIQQVLRPLQPVAVAPAGAGPASSLQLPAGLHQQALAQLQTSYSPAVGSAAGLHAGSTSGHGSIQYYSGIPMQVLTGGVVDADEDSPLSPPRVQELCISTPWPLAWRGSASEARLHALLRGDAAC